MSAALTLGLIQSARQTLAGRVRLTPSLTGEALLPNLWLKAENMQVTGSFKARGALNRVLSLTDEEKRRGLVTASGGNHALALAWAAQQTGCACTVVMPGYAAPGRIRAVEARGASVVLAPTMPEVFPLMQQIRAERGLTLVHPFDDPLVMAGQGTLGLEILEQVPGVSVIVVGIGGGGLIGGLSTAVKSLRPEVKIYGVEPVGAATMYQSRARGRAGSLDKIETIADGLSAPYVSEATYTLTQQWVDDVVLVTDDDIRAALQALLIQAKLVVEPAGAAATAALQTGRIPVGPGDRVVSLLSGGNIDLDRLKTLL